jgi:DNA-binding transcriptional MocR family regulator
MKRGSARGKSTRRKSNFDKSDIRESLIISGSTAAQIISSIESGIRAGTLTPGLTLPRVRELAVKLDVNRNTVSSAYRRLADAGFVVTDGRRGSHIANAPYSRNIVHSSKLMDLGGGPDPTLLPDPTYFMAQARMPIYLYDDLAELPDLLAITRRLFADDAVPSEHVTFTNGAFDAVRDILCTYLKPGDKILLEDPCFMTSLYLVRELGIVPISAAVDDDGIRPEAVVRGIEAGAKAVLVTPHGQNPTGAAWTKTRREELRKIFAGHPNVVLIEDDHLRGLVRGETARSLAATRQSHWAVVRSVSKYYGPDLRFAYVAGDEKTIRSIRVRRSSSTRRVSCITQHIVLRMMDDPNSNALIARAAQTYEERRIAMKTALSNVGVSARGKTGLHLWVPVHDEAGVAQALLQRGWAVRAGNIFRIRSSQGVRITPGNMEYQEAERFAQDLAATSAELLIAHGT